MHTQAALRGNRFQKLSSTLRAVALVLLAMALITGCATGPGGMPGAYPQRDRDPYGGGYGSERILGTVQSVDRGYNRIVLIDELRGQGGAMELYFDRDTRLMYQGRAHAVEGLERGDRISVDAVRSGGRLFARHIEVVHNVRERGGYRGDAYPDPRYPDRYPDRGYDSGELQGAVSHVDPGRRLIVLTRGGYSGARQDVTFDDRTRVEYQGRPLRPEQLEPGDVIRVRGRPLSHGYLAEYIQVEVNARGR